MSGPATAIKTWQVSFIPGLLQTVAYARSLRRSKTPDEHPDQTEEFAASRVARQQRLSGEAPLSLWAVIPEAALRIAGAEPEASREQLTSLLGWSERPNVTIQVLPFRAGLVPAFAGSFNVISFAEPGSMDVVYAEVALSTAWVEGGDSAAQHVRLFEETARRALPEAESRAFISTLVKEL